MKSSKLAKIIGMAAITALSFGKPDFVYAPPIETGYTYEIHKQLIWDEIAKKQNADLIKKPYYRLKPSSCSKYARLSAKKLFNKKYVGGHAWDLKYPNHVVYNFEKENEVKEAIMDGELSQGMLITSKWPVKNMQNYWTNPKKKGFDIKGNPIESTHVIQYIGIGRITDEKILDIPEPLFLHQWGRKFEIKTQKQLWNDYNLEFQKVINDRPLEEKTVATTFPEKFLK